MPRVQLHRFALLIALALAGSPPVHATVDTRSASLDAPTQALRDALIEAARQGAQGDTLGALIAFDRLLADPGMPRLPDTDRLEAYVVAGWIALQSRQPQVARTNLEQARKLAPDEPRALYLLGVLEADDDRHVEGIGLITRSLQLSDQFLPEVTLAMAGSQGQLLRGHDIEYRDFLQTLFDRHWTPDGVEPTDFWRHLAVLQIDSGQSDRVAATLERIDSPMEILGLRADRRFDPFIDRSSPRFDPEKSAQRHLDALRVKALLAPEAITVLVEMSGAMLVLGQHEEVLALTERAATTAADDGVPRTFESSGDIAWLLNHRAIAQRRLGDTDAALATLATAAQFHEKGLVNISQRLNLAVWQVALLKPREALDSIQQAGDNLSPYGEAVQQWVRFAAYRQLGDAVQAERARAWLQAHADATNGYQVEALLEDNALDQAAAHLIADLRASDRRNETLMSLQQMRTVPSLPGDAERDRRWQLLVERDDVQAALNAVGRSERHALFGVDSSR